MVLSAHGRLTRAVSEGAGSYERRRVWFLCADGTGRDGDPAPGRTGGDVTRRSMFSGFAVLGLFSSFCILIFLNFNI